MALQQTTPVPANNDKLYFPLSVISGLSHESSLNVSLTQSWIANLVALYQQQQW